MSPIKSVDNKGGSEMTDLQLYILVAIPLVGILANTGLFIHLSSTMSLRFAAFGAKVDSRFTALEAKVDFRFERVDARFETLMGKVIDIDNRLIRVEDRIGIKP
jgi:hypothetical protein